MIQPLRPSSERRESDLAELAPFSPQGTAQMPDLSSHAVGMGIRAVIATQLVRGGVRIAPPGPHDLIVLLRGMPVAPWIPLRAAADVWATWLGQLERLWEEWNTATNLPQPAGEPERGRWDAWREEHVVPLQMRCVSAGIRQLISLLEHQATGREAVHLVGHSVGGATVLTYLAALRAGRLPLPPLRLRTAITLDAAVTGISGIWSGARRSLRETASHRLNGLGAWAAQRGVALVTASNEWDIWSHRALGDLPYVALQPDHQYSLVRQLDGTIHGWLRRTPHLVEELWSAPPQKNLATTRSQVDWLLGQDSNL